MKVFGLISKGLILFVLKFIGRYGGGGENDEAMDKKLAEIFND